MQVEVEVVEVRVEVEPGSSEGVKFESVKRCRIHIYDSCKQRFPCSWIFNPAYRVIETERRLVLIG